LLSKVKREGIPFRCREIWTGRHALGKRMFIGLAVAFMVVVLKI
jgi:hypothetical protein